jgi:hypothetical protein
MQSQGNANHFISIGLNFGILILAVWPTWIVLNSLDRNHEGDDKLGKAAVGEGQHSVSGDHASDKGRDS